jgi:hypothetical protein
MRLGLGLSISNVLGGASWSPTQITGVLRVLTAYQGVSTTGADVNSWTDLVASAAYSSAGAFRPDYDANAFGTGKPGITFTKGANYLEGASVSPTTGVSIFVVAKSTDNTPPPAAYANGQPNMLISDRTGTWAISLGLVQDKVEFSRFDGATVNRFTSADIDANDDTPRLFGVTHATGGGVNVYANNAVVASGSKTWVSNINLNTIGASFAYGDKFGGTIGAVVIASGIISAGDRALLYAWAQSNFGVA